VRQTSGVAVHVLPFGADVARAEAPGARLSARRFDTSPRCPPTPASPTKAALAMVCFFAASAGTVLAALGAHIHDRVRVSPRWTLSIPERPLGMPIARAEQRPTARVTPLRAA
jgi:hypothetical protein